MTRMPMHNEASFNMIVASIGVSSAVASRIFIALLLGSSCLLCTTAFSQIDTGRQVVGISSGTMDKIFANQDKTQWCWAACIQMIFRYHGFDIDQDYLATSLFGQDIFGQAPDRPAQIHEIQRVLNGKIVESNGKRYRIESTAYTRWTDNILNIIPKEIEESNPIILCYSTGVGGHAVVATAASYKLNVPTNAVDWIVIRDPYRYKDSVPWAAADPAASGYGKRVMTPANYSDLLCVFVVRPKELKDGTPNMDDDTADDAPSIDLSGDFKAEDPLTEFSLRVNEDGSATFKGKPVSGSPLKLKFEGTGNIDLTSGRGSLTGKLSASFDGSSAKADFTLELEYSEKDRRFKGNLQNEQTYLRPNGFAIESVTKELTLK